MKTLNTLLVSAAFLPSAAMAQELTFATAGGVWLETITEACLDPYAEASGVEVEGVATEDTAAQIRAQMMTQIQWDIVEVPSAVLALGSSEGWFEPLDWDKIDPEGELPEVARQENGIGFTTYSEGIVYRTDGDNAPVNSWADFWNVDEFPGNRSLRDTPLGNLEYALLADGVAKDELYDVLSTEEGVDRAFAKLDEIKPNITVWWTAGQQPIQYIASGDVDYSTTWNGRVTSAVNDGIPAGFVWNEAALIVGYYAVLKGTEQADLANDLLKFCWTDPQISANVVERMPYPGFAPGLYDLLPEETAQNLSTFPANEEVQFAFDGAFWAENRPELQDRWQSWRLSN